MFRHGMRQFNAIWIQISEEFRPQITPWSEIFTRDQTEPRGRPRGFLGATGIECGHGIDRIAGLPCATSSLFNPTSSLALAPVFASWLRGDARLTALRFSPFSAPRRVGNVVETPFP